MRVSVVDTFASAAHLGNPAAVVVLAAFPDDDVLQDAAHRIGMPTTAFVVAAAEAGSYDVRWFTPYATINVCGHATIAAARHLFARPENARRTELSFRSDDVVLSARSRGDQIALDLPAASLTHGDPPVGLLDALGVTAAVSCMTSSDDVMVELESAAAVAAVAPNFEALARQPFRGHIVTAPADSGADFVSRTFFPSLGVNEDQVCVSAHCKLTPFWAARLGRRRLSALQLSARGGRVEVEHRAGGVVRVAGSAVPRGPTYQLQPAVVGATEEQSETEVVVG